MPSRKINNRKAVRKHKNQGLILPPSPKSKPFLLPLPTQAAVKNGGFENRTLAPWDPGPKTPSGEIFVTTVNPHSGLQAARMQCIGNTSMTLKQRITQLRRGRNYQLTIWIRRNVISTLGLVILRLANTTIVYPITSIPMTTYGRFTKTIQIPGNSGSTSSNLEIQLVSGTLGADITIDDVSITQLNT
ncbi:carbohydrate binding domain-containing protein [Paenibacillus sp. SC116]|uniref:carbohydrate binding domain-containing protein n=1 Tax=Paenibacillus sp. SC116 TaxID=2968986 RepID=UPI00215A3568|nr:carbohydrate binding domain-containing protein [Paenibacillus sp. SC116]MCR8845626.1 carbohydrate binding domain-containing protein [Paenibacillus sp. SC116]